MFGSFTEPFSTVCRFVFSAVTLLVEEVRAVGLWWWSDQRYSYSGF